MSQISFIRRKEDVMAATKILLHNIASDYQFLEDPQLGYLFDQETGKETPAWVGKVRVNMITCLKGIRDFMLVFDEVEGCLFLDFYYFRLGWWVFKASDDVSYCNRFMQCESGKDYLGSWLKISYKKACLSEQDVYKLLYRCKRYGKKQIFSINLKVNETREVVWLVRSLEGLLTVHVLSGDIENAYDCDVFLDLQKGENYALFDINTWNIQDVKKLYAVQFDGQKIVQKRLSCAELKLPDLANLYPIEKIKDPCLTAL